MLRCCPWLPRPRRSRCCPAARVLLHAYGCKTRGNPLQTHHAPPLSTQQQARGLIIKSSRSSSSRGPSPTSRMAGPPWPGWVEETTHVAAERGLLAMVNRLLEQDAGRLNAMDHRAQTPLMRAVMEGQDAVVQRLLELGADTARLNVDGESAVALACGRNRAPTLNLLLDAGANPLAVGDNGWTPLMHATNANHTECVAVLLARGGDAVGMEIRSRSGSTAMHYAAMGGDPTMLQLFLKAGANLTVVNEYGRTPLDISRDVGQPEVIALLEAAIAPSLRARVLLKARALLDAASAVPKARQDVADKGEPASTQREKAVAAAPAYLRGRVAQGQELPCVSVSLEGGAGEVVLACLMYALGLAGGGGVHEGEGPAPQGMVWEMFVELCELLVPAWDRSHV